MKNFPFENKYKIELINFNNRNLYAKIALKRLKKKLKYIERIDKRELWIKTREWNKNTSK